MRRICPLPKIWSTIYAELDALAKAKNIEDPPPPLILAGWNFSSDVQKETRWQETIAWATKNGGENIVARLTDSEFYCIK